jgi:hypothetical protein
MDLQGHLSDRAAVCHVVPFRLWASSGEPSGSKDLWASCGARRGTGWNGGRTGDRNLRQSSRNHSLYHSPARYALPVKGVLATADRRRSPSLPPVRLDLFLPSASVAMAA